MRLARLRLILLEAWNRWISILLYFFWGCLSIVLFLVLEFRKTDLIVFVLVPIFIITLSAISSLKICSRCLIPLCTIVILFIYLNINGSNRHPRRSPLIRTSWFRHTRWILNSLQYLLLFGKVRLESLENCWFLQTLVIFLVLWNHILSHLALIKNCLVRNHFRVSLISLFIISVLISAHALGLVFLPNHLVLLWIIKDYISHMDDIAIPTRATFRIYLGDRALLTCIIVILTI